MEPNNGRIIPTPKNEIICGVKAITWRIIASLTSFFLAWGVTGNVEAGLVIGVVDVIIKFILYYLHERVWYRSSYGVDK